MLDDQNSQEPDGAEEELTPEEIERAQRLFEQLAAEEPPLDLQNDTAPSKTAPRPAVQAEDTRPFKVREGGAGRYALTLALGVVLMVSLVATILVFVQDGDEKPKPEVNAFTPTPINEVDNTAVPSSEPSKVPTEKPEITPTTAVNQFVVSLPPTAAADEAGAWLLTPVAPASGGTVGDGSVVRQDSALTVAGGSSRLQVVTYHVQKGDTLTKVAGQFQLDLCTIVWSNSRSKVSPMREGYVLDIMPTDGVFYKVDRQLTIQEVAEATAVSPYAIIDSPYNKLFGATPQTILSEGMKIVVPGGALQNCNIWAPPKSGGSGSSGGVNPRGGGLLCDYGGGAGSYPSIIPVAGRYTFFQGYSPAHTGVDLSAASGTTVVAAGAGVVAFAGWNEWGYGNAIVIDHGGTFTLYGHLSGINVTCGQAVGAGEAIGAVGSTGRSSGPHLHFEIRDAGFNPMDPTLSIGL